MKKVIVIIIVGLALASCQLEKVYTDANILSIDAMFENVTTKSCQEGPFELIEVGSDRILPMRAEVSPLIDCPDTKGTLVQSQSDFAKEFGSFTLCAFDGATEVLNETVIYDQSTSSWKLQSDFIWDWGKELEFIAWNNDGRLSVESIVPGESGNPTEISFKCNSISSKTAEGTKDAMIGYYKGTGDKGKATLEFTHLYGGIRFTLSEDFEEGSKILSITLKDAIDKGTGHMTFDEDKTIEWVADAQKCDYSQTFEGGISIQEFNKKAENFLLPEYDGTMELTMNLPSEGIKTFTTRIATPGTGLCRNFEIKRTGKAILIKGQTDFNSRYTVGFNFLIRQLYETEDPNGILGNSKVKKIEFKVKSSVNSGMELQSDGSDFKIRANISSNDSSTVIISTPADKIYLSSASHMFAKMVALEEIQGFEYLDSRECTGFREMCDSCVVLKKLEFGENFQILYPNISHNPVNFFRNCRALSSIDMTYPFANLSKVTSLASFFSSCTNLKSIIMPDKIDTSNITNMSSMFANCRSLSDYSFLTLFDTSNVDNMSSMFFSAGSGILTIDLTKFNTSNVENMYMMFAYSDIKNIDLSSFSSEKLVKAIDMFNSSRVKNITFGSEFTLTNVKDISGMFRNCYHIDSLDISHFNPLGLTSCANMFTCPSTYTPSKWSYIDFGSSFTPDPECDVTNALYSYFEYEDTLTIKCNSATKQLLDTDSSGRDKDNVKFELYPD